MSPNIQVDKAPSSEPTAKTAGRLPRVGAVGLAGLALLAGCGPSVQEKIAALPEVTPVTLKEGRLSAVGTEVAIKGEVTLLRDDSYSTTSTVLFPISTGKSVALIPLPNTVRHTQLWYSLQQNGENVRVFSTFELHPKTFVIGGTIQQTKEGETYLHANYALHLQ